jgi:uncharacterized protein (TIGR00369 family)
MPALSTAEAQQILADNFAPWVLALNLQVEAVSAQQATLRLPFHASLQRVGGMICGQALMSAADTAMVIALAAQAGGFRPCATVTQTVSFLRPASEQDVLVVARILRAGKSLAFGEIALMGANDAKLVMQASTIYALM